MFVEFDVDPGDFIQTNTATLKDKRAYYIHKSRILLLVLRMTVYGIAYGSESQVTLSDILARSD